MHKASEIKEKKPEELILLERDLRRELGELQLKVRMGTTASTARLGQIRREIARILTIRREKQ
ncbi:MAG: 50S ribosomal protein L29 [Deltaproteobacteria bacterium]|nr:50S ribosomal protein L29 [Deltaproteobacteria bacterium]